LGRANWWLPGWLDRFIPQLTVEGAGPSTPATSRFLVPTRTS
jgi:RND superfamily putative drug exporter